jgi:hypothetical protein
MLALVIVMLLSGAPDVPEPTPDEIAATAKYIMVLKPSMKEKQAIRLSKIVRHYAVRYNLDPDLMVAIIRQESNFVSGLTACWPAAWKGSDETTCDYGLAQINQTWIDSWGLDPVKLANDDWYNISVQARVLAWLQRYYGDEIDWFGRYHSATPSKKSKYLKELGEYLALR